MTVSKVSLQASGPNTSVSLYYYYFFSGRCNLALPIGLADQTQEMLKKHKMHYSFILLKFQVQVFLSSCYETQRTAFFKKCINDLQKGWQKGELRSLIRLYFYFLGTFYLTEPYFPPTAAFFDRCQSNYNLDIRTLSLSTPFLCCFYMKGGKHAVIQDDWLMSCVREILFITIHYKHHAAWK